MCGGGEHRSHAGHRLPTLDPNFQDGSPFPFLPLNDGDTQQGTSGIPVWLRTAQLGQLTLPAHTM